MAARERHAEGQLVGDLVRVVWLVERAGESAASSDVKQRFWTEVVLTDEDTFLKALHAPSEAGLAGTVYYRIISSGLPSPLPANADPTELCAAVPALRPLGPSLQLAVAQAEAEAQARAGSAFGDASPVVVGGCGSDAMDVFAASMSSPCVAVH
eukprot:NODE_21226_length_763_cov_5.839623.p1 GENE.NODE_21226_length_763_cov_5.839623~~NODE_21226_length_763_cov_5.839623.p1  ORF type:complete len:170 (+),score=61.48 NODE_21226_length_763_cov_5.839623:49-510(+)